MKVLKFGGSAVATPQSMKNLLEVIVQHRSEKSVVVLTAVSEFTDSLALICDARKSGNHEKLLKVIDELFHFYTIFIENLFITTVGLNQGQELIIHHFDLIRNLTNGRWTGIEERKLMAQGALISTGLFCFYLEEAKVHAVLLPALSFIHIDENSEPCLERIHQDLNNLIDTHPFTKIFITQGDICKNALGEIDTLQGGGSDSTAALIGAVLRVDEIQIWTELNGFYNGDPNCIKNTSVITQMHFDQAAELATFYSAVVHPQCILFAKRARVPIRIFNFQNPNISGTLICDMEVARGKIAAIAAKDAVTAIRIFGGNVLRGTGLLSRILEVFDRNNTPIGLITTTEIAVSVTIDKTSQLEKITMELRDFEGVEVEVEGHQAMICVVGDFRTGFNGHLNRIVDVVKEQPIRMISYGGSTSGIVILIQTEYKIEVLQLLQNRLF